MNPFAQKLINTYNIVLKRKSPEAEPKYSLTEYRENVVINLSEFLYNLYLTRICKNLEDAADYGNLEIFFKFNDIFEVCKIQKKIRISKEERDEIERLLIENIFSKEESFLKGFYYEKIDEKIRIRVPI